MKKLIRRWLGIDRKWERFGNIVVDVSSVFAVKDGRYNIETGERNPAQWFTFIHNNGAEVTLAHGWNGDPCTQEEIDRAATIFQ